MHFIEKKKKKTAVLYRDVDSIPSSAIVQTVAFPPVSSRVPGSTLVCLGFFPRVLQFFPQPSKTRQCESVCMLLKVNHCERFYSFDGVYYSTVRLTPRSKHSNKMTC